MALPPHFRFALLPLVALTTLELALYHTLDFMVDAWGGVTALLVISFALLTSALLTAVRSARSFTERRFDQGLALAVTERSNAASEERLKTGHAVGGVSIV